MKKAPSYFNYWGKANKNDGGRSGNPAVRNPSGPSAAKTHRCLGRGNAWWWKFRDLPAYKLHGHIRNRIFRASGNSASRIPGGTNRIRANLIFHIVFGTKNRIPMITPKLAIELYPYIGGVTRGEDGIPLAINGTEDHVHLVVKLKPRHSIPEILKRIKGNSSKWINDNMKISSHFSWQIGYGIFSMSESRLPRVLEYVANQKRHHRKKTFEEEFIQLLEKHGIEYDPKYLWK